MKRREFVAAKLSVKLAGALAVGPVTGWTGAQAQARRAGMYGLIGKMLTTPGKRDEVIAILLRGTRDTPMPGCLSYVVAKDPEDENGIWITEVWDGEESHTASLQLPAVKQAIAEARPMIAGFGARHVTAPAGGYGLKEA